MAASCTCRSLAMMQPAIGGKPPPVRSGVPVSLSRVAAMRDRAAPCDWESNRAVGIFRCTLARSTTNTSKPAASPSSLLGWPCRLRQRAEVTAVTAPFSQPGVPGQMAQINQAMPRAGHKAAVRVRLFDPAFYANHQKRRMLKTSRLSWPTSWQRFPVHHPSRQQEGATPLIRRERSTARVADKRADTAFWRRWIQHFGDEPFVRGNLDAGRLSWFLGRRCRPSAS